jgi:AraC-like DNA-binding protein
LFAPSGFLNTVAASISPHVYDQNFDAGKAAEVCGFTKSALARRLAKHDTSISELITNMRMKYAQTALSATSEGVEEIASKVGYLDPTAFARAFKSWFGQTPTEFRNDKRSYQAEDLE